MPLKSSAGMLHDQVSLLALSNLNQLVSNQIRGFKRIQNGLIMWPCMIMSQYGPSSSPCKALQEAVLRLWRSCPARCAGLWWGASTVPTGDCVQHSEVHLPEHDQPSEV